MRKVRARLPLTISLALAMGLLPACSGSSKKAPDADLAGDSSQQQDVPSAAEDAAVTKTDGPVADSIVTKADSPIADSVVTKADGRAADSVVVSRDAQVGDDAQIAGSDAGTGGTYTCDGQSCCVPIAVSPKFVWARVTGPSLCVAMAVVRTGGDGQPWTTSLDLTAAGTTVTYSSSIFQSLDFLDFSFPCITLDPSAVPACGSMMTFRFRVRSSTYADNGSTGTATPVCAAVGSTEFELQQPVLCLSCPSPGSMSNKQPCPYPNVRCDNSTSPGPYCECKADYRTHELGWVCPTP